MGRGESGINQQGFLQLGGIKLSLRLSSSFACVTVKFVVGWKRETVLAHIVGGVHFEGARIGLFLKYKQKTKKDEPEKT